MSLLKDPIPPCCLNHMQSKGEAMAMFSSVGFLWDRCNACEVTFFVFCQTATSGLIH